MEESLQMDLWDQGRTSLNTRGWQKRAALQHPHWEDGSFLLTDPAWPVPSILMQELGAVQGEEHSFPSLPCLHKSDKCHRWAVMHKRSSTLVVQDK